MSSPTQSSSTFFSEPGTELASRVWVSDVVLSKCDPKADQWFPIQIPLADLVLLDKLLDIDLEGAEKDGADSVPELRRERRSTRSDGPRRRNTQDSASISDVIDQAMRRPSGGLVKSPTWPTHTAGQTYIDALSRDLRSKLFTSSDTSLNLPD